MNKTSSYVLLHLLGGAAAATEISKKLPTVSARTIQRALSRLLELNLASKAGPSNDPTYSVNFSKLLEEKIPDTRVLDEDRPETGFHFEFLDWLSYKAYDLHPINLEKSEPMTKKELEVLTVELSWKSSALEGNTYSLLDTQLLLTEGVRAKNHTDFETQMIVNHKEAIDFIVENGELFNGEIKFSTVEELHRKIGYNLAIDTGIRKRLTRISASNYLPMNDPHKLRESVEQALEIISNERDPFLRALLVLSLVPYLQAFEDGNKRTGRLLANAVLIHSVGRGFSLRNIEARELAIAYLKFYEFNSLRDLSAILHRAVAQSQ